MVKFLLKPKTVKHPASSARPLILSNQMKLPNGERAIVDIAKLQGYCLNPHHSRGRNKARVFASAGIRQADAEELRTAPLVLRILSDNAIWSTSIWSARAEQSRSAVPGSYESKRTRPG
jgi:hypothetical protein